MGRLDKIFVEIIAKIEQDYKRARPNSWKESSLHSVETARKLHFGLESYIDFIQNAEIVTRDPKLFRKHKPWMDGFIEVGSSRGVLPQVFLVARGTQAQVTSPKDLGTVTINDEGGEFVHLPRLATRMEGPFKLPRFPEPYGTEFNPTIVAALQNECGAVAKELSSKIGIEWEAVRSKAPQILEKYLRKNSGKEREVFVKKLASILEGCHGLMGLDPKSLLDVFKLEPKEIDVLLSFARRNRGDIDVVVPEDVEKAQKLAQVGSVMKT